MEKSFCSSGSSDSLLQENDSINLNTEENIFECSGDRGTYSIQEIGVDQIVTKLLNLTQQAQDQPKKIKEVQVNLLIHKEAITYNEYYQNPQYQKQLRKLRKPIVQQRKIQQSNNMLIRQGN